MGPRTRRTLIGLGAFVLVSSLFHLEENARGRHAWARWQALEEAQGFRYDPTLIVPPPVAAADNFAAAPIIADAEQDKKRELSWFLPPGFEELPKVGNVWAGWPADLTSMEASLNGETLDHFLGSFEAPLQGLAEASRRPGSRIPIDYSDWDKVPALYGLRGMGRILRLRALQDLRRGRTEEALEEILTGLRMIRHLRREPYMVCQMLSLAWTNMFLQPVWEGQRAGAWDADQLARLQTGLESLDLIASFQGSLEAIRRVQPGHWISVEQESMADLMLPVERRTGAGATLRRVAYRILFPKGWADFNLVALDQALKGLSQSVFDPAHHQIHPERLGALEAGWAGQRGFPYHLQRNAMLPFLSSQAIRVARSQAGLDLARTTCALERWRRDHGNYPRNLEILVPNYLPSAASDVTTGKPLTYATAGSSCRLYSVGWNRTDEGGLRVSGKPGQGPDPETGDWVWLDGTKPWGQPPPSTANQKEHR